jgi:hypothetical protein
MSAGEGLAMRVQPAPGGDAEELAELTGRLRAELLELDVASVEFAVDGQVPGRAKGVGSAVGWLAVRLGNASGLRSVLAVLADWCSRSGRTVEVSCGGDVLKVTGVSSRQQDQIIDAWLASHSAST